MSRIPTPTSIETSPAASQPMLEAVKKQLGVAPNLFRLLGVSPKALEGYLGLSGAMAAGTLDARTRQRLALVVAEENGCDYCLAAHSFIAEGLKMDDAEILAARRGESSDPKERAAVVFATKLVRARGHVDAADVEAVRAAGWSDAQVIEIVVHVAQNTLTNYLNTALGTEIDFPKVPARPRVGATLGVGA